MKIDRTVNPNLSGIYIILNNINKKVYVGSASSIKSSFYRRFECHRRTLGLGTHHNKHLQRAYNKYGKDSFIFRAIEVVVDANKENVLLKENEWMDRFKSRDLNYGYNLSDAMGGFSGCKHSEESKMKMSESQKKIIHSQEWKDKISIKNKNRVYHKERIDKLIAMNKSRVYTEEYRIKIGIRIRAQAKKKKEKTKF